jgi:hypothetical protein
MLPRPFNSKLQHEDFRAWSSSSIILRKWVTGVSFPRDPHYVAPEMSGLIRRASGLVLVGNPEVRAEQRVVQEG